MQSTTSILKQLKNDFPQFIFKKSDNFLWSSSDNTIYFCNLSLNNIIFLIHELSHALLHHTKYDHDITLLAMERQAWDKTVQIAPKYGISIDEDIIQSNLDSYRDWLHARSTCPKCNANGLQIDKSVYKCPACTHSWRVNEARTCSLRRYNCKK